MLLRSTDATRRLAYAAFFGSGAAGLIYQVCWIRQASLIFGSTTFAVSSVLDPRSSWMCCAHREARSTPASLSTGSVA